MATTGHFKGALLEEVVLYLLRVSGYRPVTEEAGDRSLKKEGHHLHVRGRGGVHQIDAIADYRFTAPFSYQQRLLVEAKAHSSAVRLPVARNAVGVLKDVNEFWGVERGAGVTRSRYHYNFCLVSLRGFTDPVQDYAFAQDLWLFPLDDNRFLDGLTDKISAIKGRDFGKPSGRGISLSVGEFRSHVRGRLYELTVGNWVNPEDVPMDWNRWGLRDLYRECVKVGGALLGMAGGSFPLLLVPRDRAILSELEGQTPVRIGRADDGWYLERSGDGTILFSFSLPRRLFERYADSGVLSGEAALEMKETALHSIDVIAETEYGGRLLRFRLDRDWIRDLRERLR